jgi:hypothetical protein
VLIFTAICVLRTFHCLVKVVVLALISEICKLNLYVLTKTLASMFWGLTSSSEFGRT